MSGLCGWFGAIELGVPPERVLASMSAALDGPSTAPRSAATADAGLSLAVDDTAGFVTDGGLFVAIAGSPDWSHPELAALAEQRGHAAVLLDAYLRDGRELLRHLHGAFVLAVLDPVRSRALFAIDRMGFHSLYIAKRPGGALIFATTPKAVTAHPAQDGRISPQALYEYVCFARVPAPGVIYEGQEKLLAGQVLEVDGGSVRTSFYWRMSYRSDDHARPEQLKAELFDCMRGALSRSLAGLDKNRVGAFLSGGLDSSTVLGLLSEVAEEPAKAFTIGFDQGAFDETEYATAAARHFAAEHHVYQVTPDDVMACIPRIAEAYGEPFGHSSAVAVYHCARLARDQGVDTLLAGDGGDELFAGNAHYARMQVCEAYHKLGAGLRHSVIEPLVARLPGGDGIALFRKSRRYVAEANIPMPERCFAYQRTVAREASRIFAPELRETIDLDRPFDVMREIYDSTDSQSIVSRMMHLDLQVILADNDLRKVRHMCALAGVEARFPLLDESVVELSGRVPPDLQLYWFRLRHFFRRAVANYLPHKVLKKRKHGFALPFGNWLRDHAALQELSYDTLGALKTRRLISDDFIDGVVRDFRNSDHHSLSDPIWDLLILELWLQHHNDSG